jgi:hypothetical protein
VNRPAEAGQGAIAELEEYFGRDPRFYTNPAVRIDEIGTQSIITTWFEHGIAVGHLDHELEAVPGGMRLVHVMYVPGESTTVGKLLAERVWPRAMGEAWIRHGIEEMGNFQNFLPQLYESQPHSAGLAVARMLSFVHNALAVPHLQVHALTQVDLASRTRRRQWTCHRQHRMPTTFRTAETLRLLRCRNRDRKATRCTGISGSISPSWTSGVCSFEWSA